GPERCISPACPRHLPDNLPGRHTGFSVCHAFHHLPANRATVRSPSPPVRYSASIGERSAPDNDRPNRSEQSTSRCLQPAQYRIAPATRQNDRPKQEDQPAKEALSVPRYGLPPQPPPPTRAIRIGPRPYRDLLASLPLTA